MWIYLHCQCILFYSFVLLASVANGVAGECFILLHVLLYSSYVFVQRITLP